MSDDLAKEIAKGALRIEWKDTETAARRVAEYAADRIEELEAEIKLLSEGATIAHLRGAMDAHANRADDLWAEFKDRWEGEKKFALREVVKFLRGGKDE